MIKLPNMLAIDPGPKASGYVLIEDGEIYRSDTEDNEHIISAGYNPGLVIFEWCNSMGMPVGQDVFHTCRQVGRMQEAFSHHCRKPASGLTAPCEIHLIQRNQVKLALCGRSVGINDAVIRQRLIDLFPATGGGRVPAIGTKAERGPLYGVTGHAWQALAAGIAWAIQQEQHKEREVQNELGS
tara:strand:- start:508 stop:1056 length:549 start_codon:yes stop_codon:yes gene_type:complete